MTSPTSIHFSPEILSLVAAGRIDGGQLLSSLLPAAKGAPPGCLFVIQLGTTRSRPGWTIECRSDTPGSIHLLRATEHAKPENRSGKARSARRY